MLIYYCETCGMRISDEDVESGAAVQAASGNYSCPNCAGSSRATASPIKPRAAKSAAIPAGAQSSTRTATRVAQRSGAETGKSARAAEPRKAGPLTPVVILSAVGVGLMMAGLALTFSKKKTDTGDAVSDKSAVTAPIDVAALAKTTETTPASVTPAAPTANASSAVKYAEHAANTESPRAGGGLLGALTEQNRAENSSDERQKYGQYLLDDAAKRLKENPDDVWLYRGRIDRVFHDYASVQAGKDAAKTLSELKAPDGGAWPEGFVYREVWLNIGGSKVADLTRNPGFSKPAENPAKLSALTTTGDIGDNYGSRIRGYITAPLSGAYTFWICADDTGELWLSTDASPENKKKIAEAGMWCEVQNWDKTPAQKSAAVTLQRGKRYYFEVLHKEEKGGDHVAVGWQLPNSQMERPIPGARLSPYPGR